MSFTEDLEEALNTAPDWADVDVTVNGKLQKLRFFQMDGMEWALELDRHPIRPGVLLDMSFGYNLRTMVYAIAPRCGKRVEANEQLLDLSQEQWQKLFKVLPGSSIRGIGDALISLNELIPQDLVNEAKKAFDAAFALNSASPANSASPTGASKAGNRKNSPTTSTTKPGA